MKEKSKTKCNYFNLAKPYLTITLKILVIVLAVVGVLTSALKDGFMTGNTFLYFTIQSNITIAIICAVFLFFDIKGVIQKKRIVLPKWLYTLKFIFTVAIALTFLVYWCMLMPQALKDTPEYLYSLSNLTCHTFVPIFAITDFLLNSRDYATKKYDLIWGCSMPLYYLVFSMICANAGAIFDDKGSKFPYFFLDYEKNSWFQIGNGKFGVFYWIIIVLSMVMVLSLVIMWGKNRINKHLEKKQNAKTLDTKQIKQ